MRRENWLTQTTHLVQLLRLLWKKLLTSKLAEDASQPQRTNGRSVALFGTSMIQHFTIPVVNITKLLLRTGLALL